MEIREQQDGSVTILTPVGRLDGKDFRDLEDTVSHMVDGERRELVVDLAELDHIDRDGLLVLLRLAKRLERADGHLVLCSMSDRLQEIFAVAELAAVFSIAPDRRTAIQSVRRGEGSAERISRLAAEILGVDERPRNEDHADLSTQKILALAADILTPEKDLKAEGRAEESTESALGRSPEEGIPDAGNKGSDPDPRSASNRLWRQLIEKLGRKRA